MNKSDFKKLLENVSDTYIDFVNGMLLSVKTDEDREKIAIYIKDNPNADTSDIAEYFFDEVKRIPKYEF